MAAFAKKAGQKGKIGPCCALSGTMTRKLSSGVSSAEGCKVWLFGSMANGESAFVGLTPMPTISKLSITIEKSTFHGIEKDEDDAANTPGGDTGGRLSEAAGD